MSSKGGAQSSKNQQEWVIKQTNPSKDKTTPMEVDQPETFLASAQDIQENEELLSPPPEPNPEPTSNQPIEPIIVPSPEQSTQQSSVPPKPIPEQSLELTPEQSSVIPPLKKAVGGRNIYGASQKVCK